MSGLLFLVDLLHASDVYFRVRAHGARRPCCTTSSGAGG